MGTIHPDGSETEGRSPARIELEFRLLKAQPVIGNAHSDHDLLQGAYKLTLEAAVANAPDLAFEIIDWLGVEVMGLPPLHWEGYDGFVSYFLTSPDCADYNDVENTRQQREDGWQV